MMPERGEAKRVTSDDELRHRIIESAAELFAEHGYGSTKLRMVADRARVKPRTVRRLVGGRSQLFAEVVAAKATSKAAELIADAAADERGAPGLAVLLEAGEEIFAAPQRSGTSWISRPSRGPTAMPMPVSWRRPASTSAGPT